MKPALKQTAFRCVGAGIRVLRAVGVQHEQMDAAEIKGIRSFVIPLFEPFLGALVHSTPVVEALRLAVPDSQIIVAAAPLATQVFQHHPMINRIVPVSDPNQSFRAAVHDLRKLVASCEPGPRCSLFTYWNSRTKVALAMALSRSGVRAGYCQIPELLHLGLPPEKGRSQIDINLTIVRLLGHDAPSHLEPRIYFNQHDLEHIEALTKIDQGPVAVLITRTSGGQPTAWPDKRFVAVARHLIAKYKCRILLPGTRGEADALSRLATQIGVEAQSLAGKTTIAQLAALCALSDIVVSVDTGPMHVARAQGTPLVIIAPAWQSSIDWMPIDKPWARILKGPWFPPPPPASYAIEEVTVEQTIAAVEELLSSYPPRLSARSDRINRSIVTSDIAQPV